MKQNPLYTLRTHIDGVIEPSLKLLGEWARLDAAAFELYGTSKYFNLSNRQRLRVHTAINDPEDEKHEAVIHAMEKGDVWQKATNAKK